MNPFDFRADLMSGELRSLRALGIRMVEDTFDHFESTRTRPVWQSVPEDVRARFAEAAPRLGTPSEEVYEQFLRDVLPYPRGNTHPRYWGWVNGSGLPLGTLADMLASAMNSSVGAFETSAVMVEEQVIAWLREMFDWPSSGSGVLTSGCSMAQIIALAGARTLKAGFDVRIQGLTGERPLTVYASQETHSATQRAVELLGLGRRNLRLIETDSDGAILLTALAERIRADRNEGCQPICVVGNAGTVSTGAVDPLASLADLAREEDLWFHVDGAFGAFAWLSTEHREILAGLNRADSLAVDMHKWMYLPFDVGCLLVREPRVLEETFTATPAYLTRTGSGPASYPTSFSDRSIELTRRFRALKVWFCIKAYGVSGFERSISQNISDVQALMDYIRKFDDLELLSNSLLNVCCFRVKRTGWGSDATNDLNRELLARIQRGGLALASHTLIGDAFALRIANVNHRTTLQDLTDFIDIVRSEASG